MSKFAADLVKLALCKVRSEKGLEVTFGSLWSGKPTLFVFLRHFACMACRVHAMQMVDKKAEFDAKGVQIIFIGNGQAHFISKFKENLNIPEAVIYTDPGLESFRAAGFKRGFLVSHGPQSIANIAKLAVRGHTPGIPAPGAGDMWQLGGVLFIRPPGTLGYQFISEAQGDFPPENDLQAL